LIYLRKDWGIIGSRIPIINNEIVIKNYHAMKTVITSSGKNLKSIFDLRFGRAAWFCLLDEESGQTTFIENPEVNAARGAGSKVAEKMVEMGVEKVISGDFGPKAKDMLERFNIQMVILDDGNLTIKEIIKKIK